MANSSPVLLRKEEYIYMDCSIRMSVKAMANLMYAAIITHSGLPTSYGVGIYDFSRKQNSFNIVDVKVYIHPSQILKFESYAEVKLRKPIYVTLD